MTERFERLARSVAKGRNAPDLPMLILPPTEVVEYGKPEAVRKLARDLGHQVLETMKHEHKPK